MIRYIIPLLKTKSEAPFVCFTSPEGKAIYALLDSGSEMTLIDKTFSEKFPEAVLSSEEKGKGYCVGINGPRAIDLVSKTVSIPFQTGEGETASLTVEGMVDDLTRVSKVFKRNAGLDAEVLVILGSDTLKAYRAQIDYWKEKVIFVNKQKNNKTQC